MSKRKEWKDMSKKEKITGVSVFIVLIFLIGSIVSGLSSGGKSEKVTNSEKTNNNEQEIQEVEFDDELKYDGFMVSDVKAEIQDDKLKVSFRWLNNSGEDIHYTYLGYTGATQGDESLEEVSDAYDPSNKTNALFKNANGGSHRIDLEYELVNDEDVELVFGSTHTDKKDILTVELE